MFAIPRNQSFFCLFNVFSSGLIPAISVLLVLIWRYLTSPREEERQDPEFINWEIDFEEEIEEKEEEKEEEESIHEESEEEDENLLKPSEIPEQLMSFLGPMMANGFVFQKVEQPVIDRSHYAKREAEEAKRRQQKEEEEKKKQESPAPEPQFQDQGSHPFECPVCCMSFSSEIPPRVLACGHTICTQCVTTLGGRIGDNFLMPCPMCTKNFRVLPKNVLRDIKVNHALVDIMEKRKDGEDVIPTPQCYNCLQEYSSHIPQLIPRVLERCGHTECEGCVREKIRVKRTYVRCSKCGKDSNLFANWEDTIVKNFALMDVIRM